MKIYTCASESVLSGYIPFSTVKRKFYEDRELPYHVLEALKSNLSFLRKKVILTCFGFWIFIKIVLLTNTNITSQHEDKVSTTTLSTSSMQNAMKRLSKLHSAFVHCLTELGIFLALKVCF